MTVRRYELAISTKYVPNWTYVEAARELFQNAIDEATSDPTHVMSYSYNPNIQTLVVSNENVGLDTSSLLLGAGTKADNKNLIGQHGEGYKIAFMVLLREGKKITVFNYKHGQVWTVYLKKTMKYGGEPVVAIKVEDNPLRGQMLKIGVDGITEEEMQAITDSNLHLSQYPKHYKVPNSGNILIGDKYKGRVFVNGLYVATLEEFQFGYDLLPNKLQMDRDRRLVRSFDLSWETSYMWKRAYVMDSVEADDATRLDIRYGLKQLLSENKYDVRYISDRGLVRDNLTLAEDIADDFVKEHGENAVPVTTQSEVESAKVTGRTPIIVPEPVKTLINSTDRIKEPEVETPIERLYGWYEGIKERLTLEEKVEFEDIYSNL